MANICYIYSNALLITECLLERHLALIPHSLKLKTWSNTNLLQPIVAYLISLKLSVVCNRVLLIAELITISDIDAPLITTDLRDMSSSKQINALRRVIQNSSCSAQCKWKYIVS